MTTNEQRKEQAVALMQQLGIYKPYINGFKNGNKVCFYENFGGFWVYQEPEVEQKMKELEQEYNCTVFAITHEYTNIGEMYDFLLVSNYPEEWSTTVRKVGKATFHCFAYVWNKSYDYCSEFGTIEVLSFGGGIKRIG